MLKISQKNDRNKGKHELFARRRHRDFSLKLYIHCSAAVIFFSDHVAKTSAVI